LSVLLPEVQDSIRDRRPIRFGDKYKGAVLDLRGVDGLLDGTRTSAAALAMTINGLIRAVRHRERATVVCDPMSVVVACDGVLGGRDDDVYTRTGSVVLGDGSVRVDLRKRPVRARQVRPKLVSPPTNISVLSVRRTNRARGNYAVRLAIDARITDVAVRLDGPSEVAGVMAAVADVLVLLKPGTVAIRLAGPLVAAQMLAKGNHVRLVPLEDALVVLASRWTWTAQSGWLMGGDGPDRPGSSRGVSRCHQAARPGPR
jgi:hypothetical protein